MRLKVLLHIVGLFYCFSGWAQEAETCVYSDGTKYAPIAWDNYIGVYFSNVEVKNVSGADYLYFDISFVKKGVWYDAGSDRTNARPTGSRNLTSAIGSLNLYFDFNQNVMSSAKYSSTASDLEFVSCPTEDGEPYSDYFSYKGMISQLSPTLIIGDITIQLDDAGNASYYPVSEDESAPQFYATYRWKIKDGAKGNTGIKIRLGDVGATDYFTLATNAKDGWMGVCAGGESLDVPIGGGETPTSPKITLLASSDKACAGMQQTFVATVDGNYDDIVWTLEDNAGSAAGASVGTVVSSVKGQATVTWAANVSGTYKLCGVPKLTGAADGDKYCRSITVYSVPTISLAYDNSKICAGETVVLTPQISNGGTPANVTNELKGFSWTIGTNPTSQANTLTYSVALPTAQTAYHFAAVTNDAGECPVSASINLQGGAAPAIVDASIKKELPLLGITLSGNTYYKGDMIKLSVDDNANHSYQWKLGATSVSTTNSYTIVSATASSYTGSVVVTDKTTTCSATANFNLVQDPNGCGVIAGVTDLNGSASPTICTNGVALLKAKATLTCPGTATGNFVLSYAWYKKDGSNWVRQDSIRAVENNENIFAAQSAGDYQVRIYTNRGVSMAQITVTASGSIASGDVVTTESPLTVKRGNTTILIANSSVAQSYLWMPEDMFATGGNKVQYPETKAIEENKQFKVYATHYDGCISMGTTNVNIGEGGLKVTTEVVGNPVCDDGKARMIANVEGGSGHYSYKWTEDSYSFGYSTTDQEAVIYINEGRAVSLTRVVVVTDLTTGSKGIGSVQVNVLNLKGPELSFKGVATGGLVCQEQTVKVENANSTAIASYDWYIKNNATNAYTTKLNAGPEYKFTDRGDYTVWVAAKTNAASYCYSDTVNAKTSVSVKGFDLAWTATPASSYISGQTLKAAVEATNSSGYKFTWASPVDGVQTSSTQNPNEYKLEGAHLPEYWFKVKVTDNNKCERSDSIKVSKNDLNDNGLLLTLANKEVNYCTGGTAVMSATVAGGSGPYNFTWYKEGSESSPLQGPVQVTASGGTAVNKFISTTAFTADTKIIVKVTDASSPNQLIRRDTVLVKKVNTAAPQISAGTDRIIAYGTSTYLLGTVVSGNPTSWVWADANNLTANGINTANPQTKPLTAETTYTVYATDNNGCTSASDDVKINVTSPGYELAVNINKPSLLCKGSIVTLDADVTPDGRKINGWEWGATLGSINNKALENPQLTINSVSANTKMDLLVMVTDENGVTAVDRATDITVQNTVAPELQLTGYLTGAGDYLCSNETELTVTAKDPSVTLGACTWYVNDTEVRNPDGSAYTRATYKHSVENSAYLAFKVSAVSLAGCPASNTIIQSFQVYPQPKLDWDAASASSPVQPGDQVSVTANLVKTTSANYKYLWKHDGPAQTNPPTYTDGGTTASTATSATSSVVLAGGADEDSSPYYFQVQVEDKYSCHSEQISKTITLDGNALFVTLASKYGEYCTGGDAVLVATVVTDIDEKDLEYTWYKDGSVIAGEKGKELVVKNSDITSAYYVEVKATDGSGKTGSTVANPLTLTSKTAAAPVLSGINQKIPKNTKTALIVTTNDNIVSWKWTPEDKLATNESTLRSPYTVVLSADEQKYTVYGVDANNCVGSAEVIVETINVQPPGGADDELFVKVDPSPITICKGNRLGIHTKVWSSASDSPTYEWLPNDGNLSAYNVAEPIFNPTGASLAAKTYSYTVMVRQGALVAAARADITVIEGVLPNLVVDTDNSGSYCAGSSLVVKVQNGVPVKKYTWIINGVVDETVTGNTYTWPAVLRDTRYSVRVIAESQQHCLSLDSVKVDEVISPALKLSPLQVTDSCGQVRIFSDAGSDANYTWTLTSGDTYLQKVEGVTKDTLYLKQKTPAFTAASIEYGVKLTVTPKSGGCSSEGSISSKVYFKPKVELTSWTPAGESVGLPYIMAEKGASVQQRVSTYNYDAAVNSNVTWSPAQVQGSATAAILNNVQKDDSIIIVVANKELQTCQASDTMPVYLYPEAPTLKIDTIAKSFVKAGLYLSGGSGDAYTIWSRKWDPYCTTTRYTGDQVYVKEPTGTNLPMTSSIWPEPSMRDTLKYYYVTSGRTIKGRMWEGKTTSDTVGYYLFDLNLNDTKTSDNYMAVYFNFDEMDCPTMLEVARRINKTDAQLMIQMYKFDYLSQTLKLNTYMGSTDKIMGTVFTMDIPMMVIRPKTASQFMQYGVLPKVEFNILRTNTTVNNVNWIYTLPSKAHILEIDDLFSSDFTDVMQLNRWLFDTQGTSLTTKLPIGTITGNKTALYPLQVIGVNLRNTVSGMTWK